jgi:hypothetical protein
MSGSGLISPGNDSTSRTSVPSANNRWVSTKVPPAEMFSV